MTLQNDTVSSLQSLFHIQGQLFLAFGDASSSNTMDLTWLVEFLKGMVKPVVASSVVLLAVALSFLQKLGLEGEMVYSIVRAFLQLSVIGFVLQFIFSQDNVGWIILAYLFMVRSSFRYIYTFLILQFSHISMWKM